MNEKQIKELIRQTIREDIKTNSLKEVGTHDWRYNAIKKMWDKGSAFARKKIAAAITKNPNSQWSKIDDYLKDMDYEEIVDAGELLHVESIKEETTSDIIKDLDKLRHDLIKKVDVLIAKKKKLYSNVDITTPMSADEKKLDKDIADLFSQIQQIIRQKRTIKESVNEEKSFTPEKRREPKVGEIEIVKGKGNRQTWFYVDNEDDAKRLVRMGRNSAFPTGITKNKSKVKFDKGYMIGESVNEELPHQKEMVDGIVDMLNQVEDLDNRKEMALDRLNDFKKEGIEVDETEFLNRCGLGSINESPESLQKELEYQLKWAYTRIYYLLDFV